MKQTLPRGLGLVLATSLWLALTLGVILVGPIQGEPGASRTSAGRVFSDAPQEPPPDDSFWHRVSVGTHSLFHRQQAEEMRKAVQAAAEGLGVSAWHRAGHSGQGVKIAILDSGFKGYRAALGKALPATVKAKSFRKDLRLEAKASQHGILCAEVIHHLAPRAEILFANWEPDQPESFLQALRWARSEGARIISCSIIIPGWSDGEGGGRMHQAMTALLGKTGQSDGALFFASAGNTALRHWSGAFQPDADGWHQWGRGKKDNALKPSSKDGVSIELCSSGATTFELLLRDTILNRDVARSLSKRGESTCAVLRYLPQPGRRYSIRVRLVPDEAARQQKPKGEDRFHLTVLGGRLQFASRSRSIPFPGDGREVVAVGAVDEQGRRYSYSSCGPNAAAPKPDLVAKVPFPSVWRPHQAFGGTSAAAPQAAALAALVWSGQPAWSADQVRQALRQAALRTTPGHSVETGFGLLRMPALPR
jgi:subtilisin family serine protease